MKTEGGGGEEMIEMYNVYPCVEVCKNFPFKKKGILSFKNFACGAFLTTKDANLEF